MPAFDNLKSTLTSAPLQLMASIYAAFLLTDASDASASLANLETLTVTCHILRDFHQLDSLVHLVQRRLQSTVMSSITTLHIMVSDAAYLQFKDNKFPPPVDFALHVNINALEIMVPNFMICPVKGLF